MADAGFKIVVEGEKEFKAAIKEINEVIKVNKSELQLLSEQYKVTEQPMETLKEKQKSLSDAMELQAEKSRKIADEMEKVSATYGDHDSRVMELVKAYNESETELAKLQGEYTKTSESISSAESAMAALADMQKEIDESSVKFRQSLENVNSEISSVSSGLEKNVQSLENVNGEIASVNSELEKNVKWYGDNKAQIDKLDQSYSELTKNIETQKKNIASLSENLEKAQKVYGENAKETEIYRKQLDEATAALNDMSSAAEDNREKVGELTKDGGGFGGMLSQVNDIAKQLGIEMPKGLSTLIEGFNGASIAAAGIGTVLGKVASKMKNIMQETIDWADELKEKSSEMSIDTEQYQALEYAATKFGVSMDIIDKALKEVTKKVNAANDVVSTYSDNLSKIEQDMIDAKQKLLDEYFEDYPQQAGESLAKYEEILKKYEEQYNKNLEKIDEDYKTAKDSLRKSAEEAVADFNALGVEISDSTGEIRPAVDIFYDLVDAFDDMDAGIERSGAMTKIFGEEARRLNPIIDAGVDALKEYEQEAEKLGLVLGEETTEALNEVGKEFDSFRAKLKGLWRDMWADITVDFGTIVFDIQGNDKIDNYRGRKYAAGTSFSPEGWAKVGENGPEIVHLPRGSQVFPTGVTPRELSNGGGSTVNNYNITIPASDIKEFNDIVRIVSNQRSNIRMGYIRG